MRGTGTEDGEKRGRERRRERGKNEKENETKKKKKAFLLGMNNPYAVIGFEKRNHYCCPTVGTVVRT